MVLIQMLLPTNGPAFAGAPETMAALAETRRELADKFDGLTAYLRSPAKGGRRLTDTPNKTTRHGGGRHRPLRSKLVARLCRHADRSLPTERDSYTCHRNADA
jgi:hypothetical protein